MEAFIDWLRYIKNQAQEMICSHDLIEWTDTYCDRTKSIIRTCRKCTYLDIKFIGDHNVNL